MSRYIKDINGNWQLIAGVSVDQRNFEGTREEWEALSQTEKNKYDTLDLIDDYLGLQFDNVPTENSNNLVNSGSIYNTIEDIDTSINSINTTVNEEISNRQSADTSLQGSINTLASKLDGIYIHVLSNGVNSRQTFRIKMSMVAGSYTRHPIIIFSCAGGGLYYSLIKLSTENNTPSASILNLGPQSFTVVAGKDSENHLYADVSYPNTVYDSTSVMCTVDFTLTML